MKLLLDTHTFLWIIHSDKQLSKKAEATFLDTSNEVFLSAASYWEICIKQGLGKLKLKRGWEKRLDREMSINNIMWLPIEKRHCQSIVGLPRLHRDPFDRLLIAQAQSEQMTLLSIDPAIAQYDVKTLW